MTGCAVGKNYRGDVLAESDRAFGGLPLGKAGRGAWCYGVACNDHSHHSDGANDTRDAL